MPDPEIPGETDVVDPGSTTAGEPDVGDPGGNTIETGTGEPDVGDPSAAETEGASDPAGSPTPDDAEKYRRIARHQEAQRKAAQEAAQAAKAELDTYREKTSAAQQALVAERDAANKLAVEVQGQLDAARAMIARFEIGASRGLTMAQSRRLQGSTPEELEADAVRLIQDFAVPTGSTSSTSGSGPVDMVEFMRRQRGL